MHNTYLTILYNIDKCEKTKNQREKSRTTLVMIVVLLLDNILCILCK
jgi:hypothetical protein